MLNGKFHLTRGLGLGRHPRQVNLSLSGADLKWLPLETRKVGDSNYI